MPHAEKRDGKLTGFIGQLGIRKAQLARRRTVSFLRWISFSQLVVLTRTLPSLTGSSVKCSVAGMCRRSTN
jgi:hypothetical protein